MTTPRIEEMVEEFAKELSADVRWSSGYGQYENDSKEQQAYIDGVTTAIGMMYIGLTGTPKSEGMLRKALTQAHQAWIDEAVEMLKQKKIVCDGEPCRCVENGRYNQALDNTIKALQDKK